jgi:hypothetical protein
MLSADEIVVPDKPQGADHVRPYLQIVPAAYRTELPSAIHFIRKGLHIGQAVSADIDWINRRILRMEMIDRSCSSNGVFPPICLSASSKESLYSPTANRIHPENH